MTDPRVHWDLASTWRGRAGILEDVPWLRLQDHPGAIGLKRSISRSVWRVTIAEHAIVAKVYHHPRPMGRLKSILVGPPGLREFRAAVFAANNGLNVIRPVAWGRAADGTHLFLSEAVANAEPLLQCWLAVPVGSKGRDARREVIKAVSRLVNDLHATRFGPTDLHPENILLSLANTGDELQAVLVDLHRATWGRPVSRSRCEDNIADLHQWFQYHASRTDQLRFLDAYLGQSQASATREMCAGMIRRIRARTAIRAEQLACKRDRRIYGDNAYVGRVFLPGGWEGWVLLRGPRAGVGSPLDRRTFTKADWAGALPPLLAATREPHDEPGNGNGDDVGLNRGIRLGSMNIEVLCLRADDGCGQLRRRWERAHHLLNRLMSTPVPLALLERDRQTMLVMERPAQ